MSLAIEGAYPDDEITQARELCTLVLGATGPWHFTELLLEPSDDDRNWTLRAYAQLKVAH